MAIRTTFVDVVDGDQLNEGYFNSIFYGTKTGFDLISQDSINNTYLRMGNNTHKLFVENILESTTNMTSGVVATSGTYSGQTRSIGLGSTTTELFTNFGYSVFKKLNESGITVSRTSTGEGAGTSVVNDSNLLNNEGVFYFTYNLTSVDTGSAAKIRLYDGTNAVDLITVGSAASVQDVGLAEVFFDWANKKIVLNKHLFGIAGESYRDLTTTYISASNLVGSCYLRVEAQVDSSGGNVNSTVTKLRGKVDTPASSVTLSLSTDGGSNFTTMGANTQLMTITNPGSVLVAKMNGVANTNEVIDWSSLTFRRVS